MTRDISSWLPIDKVTNGVIAGALMIVVSWLLKEYAGVEMPAEVQQALGLLIAGLVAYFTPLKESEITTPDE